ncbi:MAG: methionine--tRNA ligase [Anaerolineae bacterium]|nr:methionine--tRNA ligase [Chloroflexota bacterium]MBP6298059.1 methionine--tRNA ligase [Anaerolineae bacterium]
MTRHIHVSVGWPYSNGDLHVGHLAGAYLPADIFARYHRLKGNQVLMVSGSDSHGTPISIEADKRGVSPREIFEHYHLRFVQTQQKLGISYDLFTHTDTENHHRLAQRIFTVLLEKGYLYTEAQKLLYSEKEKRFLPDRYVEGECYFCHFAKARGDQCDNCGNLIDATQLINPHNRFDAADKLVVRESTHYFLDLSRTADKLLAYLETSSDRWRPAVVNFAKNMIQQGVKDDLRGRAYTRDLDWGIPVPLEGWDGKCIYVWFEAVNGYLTASVEWAQNQGTPDAWKDWWHNPEAETYYFIGKDNVPFHTVIWPAQLIGVERLDESDAPATLNLPYDVPANQFMNIEGQKFSKSNNWAIWVPDILERYQADAIRYYIAATFPEGADADFAWDGFLSRVNGELVAAWGNLVNRMLTFAYKRFEGKVPTFDALTEADHAMIAAAEAGFDQVGALLEKVKLREALSAAFGIVREANGYIDRRAPWKSIKEDPADAARAVYTVLRVIDNLKVILSPFLPHTAQQVHEYLGHEGRLFGSLDIVEYQETTRAHKALVYSKADAIGSWVKSELQPGQTLREPQALFVKLDPSIVDAERAFLGAEREERDI